MSDRFEKLLLNDTLSGFNDWWGILDEKVIPATYMGPTVGYGEWGIIDTWRRKKPEFWGTKKAYSPTKILNKQISEFSVGERLSIPVHNRFDHTNFNELKITWKYNDQSGIIENAELAPHQKGEIEIPALNWGNGEKLNICFYKKYIGFFLGFGFCTGCKAKQCNNTYQENVVDF